MKNNYKMNNTVKNDYKYTRLENESNTLTGLTDLAPMV
jgi:hypothetical protein